MSCRGTKRDFALAWSQGIKANTPRWDDIRFPATGQLIDISAGRIDFNYTECTVDFATNARYPEEPLCSVAQFPHSRLLGSPIRPHVHWVQSNASVPNILLAWRWYNTGVDGIPTWNLVASTGEKHTYTSGDLYQYTTFQEIPAIANEGVSSTLDLRVFRDTANTSGLFAGIDTYPLPWQLKEFDIHYQIDSFGSKEEFTK